MRQRNHPCGPAGRKDRRRDRGKAPRLHNGFRFGKHYRAGLQAPERVSIVRIQWSEISGQGVEQSLGGYAAKCVSGDEGYSVAATRKTRSQLSRQPVDFKHEGSWSAKEVFVETHNGAQPGHPQPPGRNRPAIGAAATCLIRWLGPGTSRKKAPQAGIPPPLCGAALVLHVAAPPTCHSPGSLEFRKSRWRGHLRGRALNDS
jgi:hypothetical protein